MLLKRILPIIVLCFAMIYMNLLRRIPMRYCQQLMPWCYDTGCIYVQDMHTMHNCVC